MSSNNNNNNNDVNNDETQPKDNNNDNNNDKDEKDNQTDTENVEVTTATTTKDNDDNGEEEEEKETKTDDDKNDNDGDDDKKKKPEKEEEEEETQPTSAAAASAAATEKPETVKTDTTTTTSTATTTIVNNDDKEPNIYEENKQQASAKISAPLSSSTSSSTTSFPAPFYCPITKKVFQDPIVLPDGITYEREALKKDRNNDPDVDKTAYPNRALKAVIDETMEMTGPSMRAGLKRMQHSMKKVLSQVMEKSFIPSNEYRPLPESYYCPITFSIMHDPVIDKEGNTFERVAVVNWIRANGTSPLTRTKMSPTDDALYPNTAIKDLLELEKNRNESSIHPSIRKWKEEEPPKLEDAEVGGALPTAGTPSSPFPVNLEEWERLEQQRRSRQTNSIIALWFTVLLIFLIIAYGGTFGILVVAAGVLCICFGSNDRDNDGN